MKTQKTNLSHLGEDFEIKLLHHILKDKYYGKEIVPILSPNYFNDINCMKIADVLYYWWVKNDEIIDFANLLFSFDLTTEDGQSIYKTIKEINSFKFKLHLHSDYTKEKALDFCYYEKVKNKINTIQEILDKNNSEEIHLHYYELIGLLNSTKLDFEQMETPF
jgi:hypothetical protein